MLTSTNNFIYSKTITNGLLLEDPNTGSGKSYYSCQAIYDYVHSPDAKQVYFTTSLLKNLCIPEMKEAYKKHKNPNYDREVLEIKSNVNFAKDNLPEAKVPFEFQSGEYKTLKRLIDISKSESFTSTPSLYQEDIEKQLVDAEYAFRKYLRKIIADKIKGTRDEKKTILKCDKNYRWIPQIYPTVFTDEYKIIFLSINKLLTRNDTLIKPSYPFISAEVLQNAIIFIDEFDATKETIKDAIIQEAIDSQNDYLDIVKELHGKLHDYKPATAFYRPYAEYAQDKPYLSTLDSMADAVDSIFEKYSLFYNYKTDSESIDRSRGFLFFDGTFRSYLKNNCHYIRTIVDNDAQQVKIYFESKEDYEKNKKLDTDINIYSLLRELTTFLNDFARFIATWADKYAAYENDKRRKSAQNGIYETFTFESAVNTICDIYFKNERLNTILHDLAVSTKLKNIPGKELNTSIEDFSFYNRGYKFFEFLDSDSHNEETKIQFVQINNTPEKILLFMAKHTKVIGLSATCRINSVLSNYALDYLKEELKDKFMFLSEESYESIKAEQKEKWKAYKDGRVNILVNSVDYGIENKSVSDRLALICNDSDLQKIFYNKLSTLGISNNNAEYYQKRYCNIFEVLKRFIENNDLKSFLCLNMALPKENEPHLDIKLLNEFAEYFCKIHKLPVPEIRILNGNDFDNQKDSLLEDLSNGKKIFVFSSYKTIGAGQNLQYSIPENEEVITIYKRPGKTPKNEKDFDGIYLGDITNVVTNINDVENIGLKELLEYLFEVKYLYSNFEIGPSVFAQLIQTGFKAYSNKKDYSTAIDSLRSCASVRRKATRDVIQAVGRLCRTFNKKNNIYIYTNNSLLTTIDNSCIRMDIVNPELEALFNYASQYIKPLPDDKAIIENEASIKSESADSYIKSILQRDWTSYSMNLWKELRETVLKYPTATQKEAENIRTIKKFYFPNYENKSEYYFAQKGDFSDIKVNIFKDYSAFKKENENEYTVMTVSEDSARLKEFFKYPGLEDAFNRNNFGTSFGNKELIISPALFNNIYKGALGEVAGRYILEKELNINLREIEEPDYYEFFDFILSKDIYIDFKHWKQKLIKDKNFLFAKILKKLDSIGGQRAYIINILKESDDNIIHRNCDDRIIEIPWLIDEAGQPNKEAIKMLIGDSNDR